MIKKLMLAISILVCACGSTTVAKPIVAPTQEQPAQAEPTPAPPAEVKMVEHTGKVGKNSWSVSFPENYVVETAKDGCVVGKAEDHSALGFCGEKSRDSLEAFTDYTKMALLMRGMQPSRETKGKLGDWDATQIMYGGQNSRGVMVILLFTTGQTRYSVVYGGPGTQDKAVMWGKVLQSVSVSDALPKSTKK